MGNCCADERIAKSSLPKEKCERPPLILGFPTNKNEKLIEEEFIVSPFFRVKLDSIFKAFPIFQYNHRLSIHDLSEVFSQLEFDSSVIPNLLSTYKAFFEGFLDQDQDFYQRKLILSIVLTNSEDIPQKLNVIEKYYDKLETTLLDEEDINNFLSEIVEVSVKIIPKITLRGNLLNPKVNLKKFNSYCRKLMAKKHYFVLKFAKIMLGESKDISFEDIREKMKDSTNKILFDSRSVRGILFDIHMKQKDGFRTRGNTK